MFRYIGRKSSSAFKRAKSRAMPTSYGSKSALLLWHSIRLPALVVLIVLEPLVSFILRSLALVGLLTTFFFYLLGVPHFPVWTMLALSIGFGLAQVLYQGAVGLLSR